MNKSILVLCTGNSCRSQMAEGFLKRFLTNRNIDIKSAGLESRGLHPRAVQVMKEAGIDISSQSSDPLEKYAKQSFDYILTVCDHAQENCPVFPGTAIRLHGSFPDPATAKGNEDQIMAQFRQTRELIRNYIKDFVDTFF